MHMPPLPSARSTSSAAAPMASVSASAPPTAPLGEGESMSFSVPPLPIQHHPYYPADPHAMLLSTSGAPITSLATSTSAAPPPTGGASVHPYGRDFDPIPLRGEDPGLAAFRRSMLASSLGAQGAGSGSAASSQLGDSKASSSSSKYTDIALRSLPTSPVGRQGPVLFPSTYVPIKGTAPSINPHYGASTVSGSAATREYAGYYASRGGPSSFAGVGGMDRGRMAASLNFGESHASASGMGDASRSRPTTATGPTSMGASAGRRGSFEDSGALSASRLAMGASSGSTRLAPIDHHHRDYYQHQQHQQQPTEVRWTVSGATGALTERSGPATSGGARTDAYASGGRWPASAGLGRDRTGSGSSSYAPTSATGPSTASATTASATAPSPIPGGVTTITFEVQGHPRLAPIGSGKAAGAAPISSLPLPPINSARSRTGSASTLPQPAASTPTIPSGESQPATPVPAPAFIVPPQQPPAQAPAPVTSSQAASAATHRGGVHGHGRGHGAAGPGFDRTATDSEMDELIDILNLDT